VVSYLSSEHILCSSAKQSVVVDDPYEDIIDRLKHFLRNKPPKLSTLMILVNNKGELNQRHEWDFLVDMEELRKKFRSVGVALIGPPGDPNQRLDKLTRERDFCSS
jgi:hypothetical protein